MVPQGFRGAASRKLCSNPLVGRFTSGRPLIFSYLRMTSSKDAADDAAPVPGGLKPSS